MARAARYVIVNAKDVRRNCALYLSAERARFVALPFGAAPRTDWLTEDPSLVAKYGLPQRYFLVSNQFWVHKNHRVVFEALSFLGSAPDAADIGVVCTGATVDPRDCGHFPALLRFIEEKRLAGRVKILGLLPKRDQVEIMKRAVAVVQPTLFEGGPGGGALYDAVSLGVAAIVSDIPVNRELEAMGGPIQFFDPQDAQGLAMLMLSRARNPVGRPDAQTLLAAGRARRQRVGAVLRATICRAIGEHAAQIAALK
jgi:glycosyltransferase involved in cell wall biosynthesis